MDASEVGALSMGNSMESQMEGHNQAVREHNAANHKFYQNLRQQNLLGLRKEAEDAKGEASKQFAAGLGETGTRVVKMANDAATTFAGAKAAAGEGWSALGAGDKASLVLQQASKTSTSLNQARAVGRGARSAAQGVSDAAQGAKDAMFSKVPAGSSVGRAGDATADAASSASTTGKVGDAVVQGGETAVKAGAKAGAEAAGAVGKSVGKIAAGAEGLGVVMGGMNAIQDIASGHIQGHNAEEKAGNELGIASGAADLLGFIFPPAALVGAALGVAGGIESAAGATKEKSDAKEEAGTDQSTGKSLDSEEKAGEEQTTASQNLASEGQIGADPGNVVKSGQTGRAGAF